MNELQATTRKDQIANNLEKSLKEIKKGLPADQAQLVDKLETTLSANMTNNSDVWMTQRDYIKEHVNDDLLVVARGPKYLIAVLPDGYVSLSSSHMGKLLVIMSKERKDFKVRTDDVGGKRKKFPLSFLKRAIPKIIMDVMIRDFKEKYDAKED
jgi:hypothetical protein